VNNVSLNKIIVLHTNEQLNHYTWKIKKKYWVFMQIEKSGGLGQGG